MIQRRSTVPRSRARRHAPPGRHGSATAAVLVAVFLMGAGTFAVAGSVEAQGIAVASAVVAVGVVDREPVDSREAFPADIGEVSFFTVLEGDFGERVVDHVWLWNGDEVARVSLTIHAPRWRTWSTKTIPADWTGAWEARLEDSSGSVLASVPFRVGG
jgi:hypothetical protein